jgi:ubiquinone/menaquinone biosynthesis C-methylase UbiE
MRHQFLVASMIGMLLVPPVSYAQQFPEPNQVVQERAQAELDVPKLIEVLGLKPGMIVADVGAGFGAMTVVLGKWIGSGHVFATDVAPRQLTVIREYVQKEALQNVTVIEGAAASTNLPEACCDAIFMRDVYHHIVAVDQFNKSVLASLKPGGRVAIIDFLPRAGSALPDGVRANRGGHGISAATVIEELTAAGLRHVRTIDSWPPGDKRPAYFLVLFTR